MSIEMVGVAVGVEVGVEVGVACVDVGVSDPDWEN